MTAGTAQSSATRSSPTRTIVAVGVVAVGVLIVGLLLGGGSTGPRTVEGEDPGQVTAWAIPLLRLCGDALAITMLAGLLVPLLIARTTGEKVRGAARRPLIWARRAALGWALVVVLETGFITSDLFAVPLHRVDPAMVTGFVTYVSQGRALLVQFLLLVGLALFSLWSLTVRDIGMLLGLALVALTPPILTGHSAESGSHDLAIVALLAHVLTISLWMGAVGSLWWLARGSAPRTEVALRRLSGLVTTCLVITVLSGVLSAWVRITNVGDLVRTGYGAEVIVKTLVVTAVAYVAMRIRRTALGGGVERVASVLVRLTALELGVMATAVALGVALSRTPQPVGNLYTTLAESLLAGPVPPVPTVGRLLFSTTASGVGLLVVLIGGVGYLWGLRRLHSRGMSWPWRRTAAWAAGLVVVWYSTMGGLGEYSHVIFSAHMASHMLLSMVAPALMVLGAPITLALGALPGSDDPGSPGPRQLLVAVLAGRGVRLLTNPLFTTALFLGSLYAVYLSGAFQWLMENHLGHAWMELHFLVVGLLFFDSLIGIDPLPHRPPALARLGIMLVVMPFHSFFSIVLMTSSTVVGGTYYRELDRGYAVDLLHDQYVGGAIGWALGEIPMLIVGVSLFVQWWSGDRREARRIDRNQDRGLERAELAAYNAELAGRAGSTGVQRREGTGQDRAPDGSPLVERPRMEERGGSR